MPAEKYSLSSYLTQYITNHDFFLCLLFHFIISLCPPPVKAYLMNRSHVSVGQFSNRRCQNVVRGTQGAADHVTIVLILVSSVIYYCTDNNNIPSTFVLHEEKATCCFC